ncbi:hypothetical protein AFCA_005002 [Aspergillus flavus]|nr:hypothetical protein AFCA_005002 [Aspergillus flavus]
MHRFPTQPENLLILTFSQARSKDDTNIFPLDGVDIESVSNKELVRLGETASVLYQIGSSKVLRISHDLVLKCGPLVLPSEGRALEFVRAKTSILVPRVFRSFQVDDPFEYYGTRAGPLGGGPCRGKFFTDYGAGPFNSGAEMEAWFNHKLKICKDYNQAPQDIPPFDFQKFVLVHQDISPRNMILDATGKVCLIDWAHAGAYPPAFERAAIVEQHIFPEFNEMTLHVMPEYDVEVRQLQSIGYGLSVAGLA